MKICDDSGAVDVEFALPRTAVAGAVALNRTQASEAMLNDDSLPKFAAAPLRPAAGSQLNEHVFSLVDGERALFAGGAIGLERTASAVLRVEEALEARGDGRGLPSGKRHLVGGEVDDEVVWGEEPMVGNGPRAGVDGDTTAMEANDGGTGELARVDGAVLDVPVAGSFCEEPLGRLVLAEFFGSTADERMDVSFVAIDANRAAFPVVTHLSFGDGMTRSRDILSDAHTATAAKVGLGFLPDDVVHECERILEGRLRGVRLRALRDSRVEALDLSDEAIECTVRRRRTKRESGEAGKDVRRARSASRGEPASGRGPCEAEGAAEGRRVHRAACARHWVFVNQRGGATAGQ